MLMDERLRLLKGGNRGGVKRGPFRQREEKLRKTGRKPNSVLDCGRRPDPFGAGEGLTDRTRSPDEGLTLPFRTTA